MSACVGTDSSVDVRRGELPPVGTRFALGTAQFGLRYGISNAGDRVGVEAAAAILAHGRACGVDMLDTAAAYGDSESRLGEIGVADWRVVTKIPRMHALPSTDVRRAVRDVVHASLARLKVNRLYGVLLHHAPDLLGIHGDAVYDELLKLRDAGMLAKIGVSVYGPDELTRVLARVAVDLVQAPFNVFDRRLVSSGWLARLHSSGVEIHVRSIFLQGLLLMPAERRPAAFARWAELWARWDNWLAQTGTSALTACLAFALSHPEIDRLVIGVDTAQQFDEIMSSARHSMPVPPAHLACEDLELINPSLWTPL